MDIKGQPFKRLFGLALPAVISLALNTPGSVVAEVSHFGYLWIMIEVVPDSFCHSCAQPETPNLGFCDAYLGPLDDSETRSDLYSILDDLPSLESEALVTINSPSHERDEMHATQPGHNMDRGSTHILQAQTSIICILDFWVLVVSLVNPDEQAKGRQYRQQQGNRKAISYDVPIFTCRKAT
ncbi:hypothetical protein ARMGADRAFT_1036695 [Armillaria gallica]|uniref:Uncharacterized protein n=1 Tax=Armillaria gallica TaxID=47427 RepID=A0A2H3CPJ1_ARMGA|nr:hypothetical protein ARMGADRAFT_1036695 [Armillaria gallica]